MQARKAVPYGRDKGAADRAAAPSIRLAYPKVSKLRIAFAFDDGSALAPSSQVHTMHPPSQAYFSFPCPGAGCNGSFELGTVIEQLVHRGQSWSADQLRCSGVRPEHRASGKTCDLQLRYQVDVSY